jgi:hypothetical protein
LIIALFVIANSAFPIRTAAQVSATQVPFTPIAITPQVRVTKVPPTPNFVIPSTVECEPKCDEIYKFVANGARMELIIKLKIEVVDEAQLSPQGILQQRRAIQSLQETFILDFKASMGKSVLLVPLGLSPYLVVSVITAEGMANLLQHPHVIGVYHDNTKSPHLGLGLSGNPKFKTIRQPDESVTCIPDCVELRNLTQTPQPPNIAMMFQLKTVLYPDFITASSNDEEWLKRLSNRVALANFLQTTEQFPLEIVNEPFGSGWVVIAIPTLPLFDFLVQSLHVIQIKKLEDANAEHFSSVTNCPTLDSSNGLPSWHVCRLGVTKSRNIRTPDPVATLSGAGQFIAVIDADGFALGHQAFLGTNPVEECVVTDGITCPTPSSGPRSAAPQSSNESHGTKVAGVALGNFYMSGVSQYAGIAENARLLAIRGGFNMRNLRASLQLINRIKLDYNISSVVYYPNCQLRRGQEGW